MYYFVSPTATDFEISLPRDIKINDTWLFTPQYNLLYLVTYLLYCFLKFQKIGSVPIGGKFCIHSNL